MLALIAAHPSDQFDTHRMKFLYTKAEAARQTADYNTAHRLLPQVLELAERLADNDVLAEVYTSYGDIAGRLSDHESATEYIERGLSIHRKTGNTHGIAESINELGVVAWGRGQYQKAGDYFEEALALFNTLDDQERIAALLGNVAAVKTMESKIDEARTLVNEALAINIELGVTWGIASSHDTLGTLAMVQGDYERALNHMLQGKRLYEQCGEIGSLPEVLASMSRVARLTADFEQSQSFAQESIGWSDRLNDQWGRANGLHALGSAIFAAGSPQDALPHLIECVQIRRDTGQESMASTLAELARVEAVLGQKESAHQHILEAVGAAQNEELIRTNLDVLIAATHLAFNDGHIQAARLWMSVAHQHPAIGADQLAILNHMTQQFTSQIALSDTPRDSPDLAHALVQVATRFLAESPPQL
jgi:tetratricopeptide (TPR) repeat protein